MTDDSTPRTDASRSQSTATGRSGSATIAASKGERHGPPITQHLVSLIERRSLDAERLTLQHGVTASESLGGSAIAIPYHDQGVQVGRKHRTLDGEKRFLQDKGSAQIFYNVDAMRDETLDAMPLVITEGEIDCWSVLQSGFPRAVSVPGGAPSEPVDEMNATKYGFVRHAQDAGLLDQERAPIIVLACDGDANGANLVHDLVLRLGAARCRVVAYPPDCKDLNDVHRTLGADAVRACIADAEAAPIEGWYDIEQWPFPPDFPALTTGMEGMDSHYKPRLGDMVLVTGIPGMGKSTFVNEIMGRMALNHRWRFVVAAFETTKNEFVREFQTFHAGMLRREMFAEDVAAADAWLQRHFSVIVPSIDTECSLEWFLETAAQAVLRFEAQALVLDPWNEMDHVRPPDMSVTEYTGFAIKQLKRFARKYRVHLIVVAHPSKMLRNRSGDIPCPTLYDVADSAHWANKPDVGIVVHRYDPRMPNTLLRFAKVRWRAIGRVGDLAGVWNYETGRYNMGDLKEILGDNA